MTIDCIEIDPDFMLGTAVIRGTRISVELILRKLAEGATEDDLLEGYPRLNEADIKAALARAADTVSHEKAILRPASRQRLRSDSWPMKGVTSRVSVLCAMQTIFSIRETIVPVVHTMVTMADWRALD
jgi:uncharacterized protein (DUF433 family)